jgi:hypothetical protein
MDQIIDCFIETLAEELSPEDYQEDLVDVLNNWTTFQSKLLRRLTDLKEANESEDESDDSDDAA